MLIARLGRVWGRTIRIVDLSYAQHSLIGNSSSKGSEGEDRYSDGCKYGGFRKSQDLAFAGELSGLEEGSRTIESPSSRSYQPYSKWRSFTPEHGPAFWLPDNVYAYH